jgi:ATP-dependent Zn protease
LNVKQQRARQGEQDKHRRKRQAEARREQYDPNDIRWVAAHEAGHAAAARVFGIPLEFVDIRRRRLPGGQYALGWARALHPEATAIARLGADGIFPYLVQMMAGPAAEALADPRYALKAGADDLDQRGMFQAATIALCGVVEAPDGYEVPLDVIEAHAEEILALCRQAEAAAAGFVAENRRVIEAIANALLQKTSLTGDEVDALVAAAQG